MATDPYTQNPGGGGDDIVDAPAVQPTLEPDIENAVTGGGGGEGDSGGGGGITDESPPVDWGNEEEGGFDWGAVAIGMAAGYVSHYTKNYDNPAKVIANMAANRKAYEKRMATLQQIQAEASNNKGLMAQLALIGGEGGVQAGARKMSKMDPETLQRKLGEWKEVKSTAQLADMLEDQDVISSAEATTIKQEKWKSGQVQMFLQQKDKKHASDLAAENRAEDKALAQQDKIVTIAIQLAKESGGMPADHMEEAAKMLNVELGITPDGVIIPGAEELVTRENRSLHNVRKETDLKVAKANLDQEVKNDADAKAKVAELTATGGSYQDINAYLNSTDFAKSYAKQRTFMKEQLVGNPLVTNMTNKVSILANLASELQVLQGKDKGAARDFKSSDRYKALEEMYSKEQLTYVMENASKLAPLAGLNPEQILGAVMDKAGTGLLNVDGELAKFGALLTEEGQADSYTRAENTLTVRASSAGQLIMPAGLGISPQDISTLVGAYSAKELTAGAHYPSVVRLVSRQINATAGIKGRGGTGVDTDPERMKLIEMMGGPQWGSFPEAVRSGLETTFFPTNSFAEVMERGSVLRNEEVEVKALKVNAATADDVLEAALKASGVNLALDSNAYYNSGGPFETAGSQTGVHFFEEVVHIAGAPGSETGLSLPAAQLMRSYADLVQNRRTWTEETPPLVLSGINTVSMGEAGSYQSSMNAAPKPNSRAYITNADGSAKSKGVLAAFGYGQGERLSPTEGLRRLVSFANSEHVEEIMTHLNSEEMLHDPVAMRLRKRFDSNWFKKLKTSAAKASISEQGYQGKQLEEYFNEDTGRFTFPPPGDPKQLREDVQASLRGRAAASAKAYGLGSTRNIAPAQLEFQDRNNAELTAGALQLRATASPILTGMADGLDVEVAASREHRKLQIAATAHVNQAGSQVVMIGEGAFHGYSEEAAAKGNYITGDTWGHVAKDMMEGAWAGRAANISLSGGEYTSGEVEYAHALVSGEDNINSIAGELGAAFGSEGFILKRAMGSNPSAQAGTETAANLQQKLQSMSLSTEDIEAWDEHHNDLMNQSPEELLKLWQDVTRKKVDVAEMERITEGDKTDTTLYKYKMSRGIITSLISEELVTASRGYTLTTKERQEAKAKVTATKKAEEAREQREAKNVKAEAAAASKPKPPTGKTASDPSPYESPEERAKRLDAEKVEETAVKGLKEEINPETREGGPVDKRKLTKKEGNKWTYKGIQYDDFEGMEKAYLEDGKKLVWNTSRKEWTIKPIDF